MYPQPEHQKSEGKRRQRGEGETNAIYRFSLIPNLHTSESETSINGVMHSKISEFAVLIPAVAEINLCGSLVMQGYT